MSADAQCAVRCGSRSHACASALAAAAAWASVSVAADPPPAERPVVEVGTVSVRPVNIESWIPGSIVSRSDARIASVIAGRVMWIADVGTRVGAGEALARLDDTVSRLRLEDLRARHLRARVPSSSSTARSSSASTASRRPRY